MSYVLSFLGDLLMWFVIFTVIVWILLYSLRPASVMDPNTDEISTKKVLLYSVIIGILLVVLMWLGRALFKWSYRSVLFTALLWFLVFTVVIWLLYYSVEPGWVLSSSGSLDYRKTLWYAIVTTLVIMVVAICIRVITHGKLTNKCGHAHM